MIQREELKYEEDDRSDTEEEKPTVVVLKSGDLTAEEAAELLSKSGDEETSSSMYTTDPGIKGMTFSESGDGAWALDYTNNYSRVQPKILENFLFMILSKI
ncbi:hypothetical protein DPMN_180037 [Dreissena polymorpha]|uniref:DUF4604 domain-containing protein n=1 Tax=Dreissena polymorpha TaxID=45954 RepID=A0A9D4EFJ1_DREPO|nr:hypothetical protein DPMN_180037 [Dreissena polymorpha]